MPRDPLGTVSVASALAGSEPLSNLMQRVRASRARFDAIAALLPPALLADAVAGPLEQDAWVLVAAHAAAAAKLRQMVPQMQQALAAQGLGEPPIRIRVRSAR